MSLAELEEVDSELAKEESEKQERMRITYSQSI